VKVRKSSDTRQESYAPNLDSISLGEVISSDHRWRRRWELLGDGAGATTTCALLRARDQSSAWPGAVALSVGKIGQTCAVKSLTRPGPWVPPMSAFAGYRFPPEVIVVAVRWYLRFNLSYRDLEELLAERDVEVDHVSIYRWVQRFTPLLADAARFCRHSPSGRWFVDETYVKVNGVWRYVYRAVDQDGQVIDVLVSARRDAASARTVFQRALATLKVTPNEVVTDAAAIYPAVLDELIPSAWHHVE